MLGKVGILLFCSWIVTACSKPVNEEDVFSKTSDECAPNEIKGQYIVRWKDGKRALMKGGDRTSFLKSFVRPNLDNLAHVESNFRVEIDPIQPLTTQSTNSSVDNWGARFSRADALWKSNVRGQGVVIAVVDTGVDTTHTQLVNQIFYNKGEYGLDNNGQDKRNNLIDDDQNGFVDDYAGYDFAANSGQVQDYAQHGTHVSGIAVGYHADTEAQTASYIQGIAPEARLLPIAFIDNSGGGTIFNAILSLEYAALRGAQVVNASWGGAECSLELQTAIEKLNNNGIYFVSAAGNSGRNIDVRAEYPAAYGLANQLTIGSVGTTGAMAAHSNYGTQRVHLFSPGVDIKSTAPGQTYLTMTGTSMATPFVSGAVALLKSYKPHATLAQIRQALYESSQKSPFYQNASQGALNLEIALSVLDRIVP